eukprot:TRINITY_DN10779_c0_g4_i1.p2 TRINITY_DN10779_c0_g4~~TRINITY_DN10779_c0_g4_i1.p2  ORF type:complete len:122 (-),score=0.48 TRINITY_DN10779_c0_g4_i1:317-682(-)
MTYTVLFFVQEGTNGIGGFEKQHFEDLFKNRNKNFEQSQQIIVIIQIVLLLFDCHLSTYYLFILGQLQLRGIIQFIQFQQKKMYNRILFNNNFDWCQNFLFLQLKNYFFIACFQFYCILKG